MPQNKAEAFIRHLTATGVADYHAQAGCRDAQLWCREKGEWVSFVLASWWTDLEAVRAYAGDDTETAVLYPGDEAFDLVYDRHVTHHNLTAIEGFDL